MATRQPPPPGPAPPSPHPHRPRSPCLLPLSGPASSPLTVNLDRVRLVGLIAAFPLHCEWACARDAGRGCGRTRPSPASSLAPSRFVLATDPLPRSCLRCPFHPPSVTRPLTRHFRHLALRVLSRSDLAPWDQPQEGPGRLWRLRASPANRDDDRSAIAQSCASHDPTLATELPTFSRVQL